VPIYQYKCKCGKKFEEFRTFADYRTATFCPKCGQEADKLISTPNLITDTNFPLTGTFDKRLGCKVEGRKHFYQKVEEKGFVPLTDHQVKNME